MQLRNLASNSPRRSRLLSNTKTHKSIAEESSALQHKRSSANLRQVSSTPVQEPAEDASPNTFFVNNFWESDGPKILFDRLNASTELQTAYRNFLKERAATEKDYAKQLRKSIESTVLLKSIEKDGGTLGSAITQQLNALDSLAAAHEALSNTLTNNLEPRLKEHVQSCEERRKKQQAVAESSFKAKQTAQTALQTATEKYRKEANSINSYSAQLTIVAPRELSRIQTNLDKCQRSISKTAEEYKLALKNYKHACSNFEYDYKMFCDLAQDIEEDKVQILCDIGAQVAEIEKRTWLNAAKAQEASAYSQVDVSTCISEFVESKGTGARIYNPPEPIDQHSAASEADTNLTFRIATFPRSSFRYPTSTMNKKPSSTNLVSSTPPQEASPQTSPARQRTASRLVPPHRSSAMRSESSTASTASELSSKQSLPSSSASDASEASDALEHLRLGGGSGRTPEPSRRSSKQNMIAIGGKMYPVNSPTPSPQTPDRVLKPRHSNSGDGSGNLPTPPYAQIRKERSPSPLRTRTVASSSAHSDIPEDMPSEKMADDTFTEIEAWLSHNRSTSPAPATSHKRQVPSSASEPAIHSSGLPVAKSRHAQRKVPLPSSPAASRSSLTKGSIEEKPHRHSVAAARAQEDVFLASPSTVVRAKSPGRSESPVAGHVRSQSDMALSNASSSSISYRRSPSPTPFEDMPRSTSPMPMSSSMSTITSRSFNRPRQPTPPEAQPQPQPQIQTAPVPQYPWSPPTSVPTPSSSPWPQGIQAQMRQPSWSPAPVYADSPVYASPYHPSSSPAPYSAAPTPAPAPAPFHQPLQAAPPPPMPQVVCYVRAEHPYKPTQDDELPLLPGDEIAIFKTDASGWWYGQSRTSQRTGLVPSNHVRML